MTVSQLIEELKQYNLDDLVLQSVDPEGNYFHNTIETGEYWWLSKEKEVVSDEDNLSPNRKKDAVKAVVL